MQHVSQEASADWLKQSVKARLARLPYLSFFNKVIGDLDRARTDDLQRDRLAF